MLDLKQMKAFIAITVFALAMSACSKASPTPQTNDQISTAVAQTVEAQNVLAQQSATALPTFAAPSLDAATAVNSPATNTPQPAVIGAPGCTVTARLASENPPDGALLKPGDTFLKTWSLENTGTCTWNTTYKLIYVKGDLMGGLTSYPLPEDVAPGQTKNISIYLKAPDTDGTYTGFWLIQTPWNTYLGVGQTNEPFYVQVAVSTDKKLNYGITGVTYKIVRDPETGCPTNVRYTVYATITTDGPYDFEYYWDQSDGNESGTKTLEFTAAGSITISREWLVGKGDSPNPRWMQIIVTAPKRTEYERAVFLNTCP